MSRKNLSPYGVAKMFAAGLSAQGMRELYDTLECVAMSSSIAADEGDGNRVNMRRYSAFASEMLGHVEELGRKMEEEESGKS